MYCRNCGNQIETDQEFCTSCGSREGEGRQRPSSTILIRDKGAGIAALLSTIMAGLGQIYVGKIGRGILLLVIDIVFTSISTGIMLSALYIGGTNEEILGAWVIGGIFMIPYFIVWIWNIFDAYKLANQYNDLLQANGRRPW